MDLKVRHFIKWPASKVNFIRSSIIGKVFAPKKILSKKRIEQRIRTVPRKIKKIRDAESKYNFVDKTHSRN